MNDVITDVNPDSGLSILEGILTAAGFKDDPDCWERINISRGGEKLFSFRIRPLDEQEVADLRRQWAIPVSRARSIWCVYAP